MDDEGLEVTATKDAQASAGLTVKLCGYLLAAGGASSWRWWVAVLQALGPLRLMTDDEVLDYLWNGSDSQIKRCSTVPA